MDLSVVVASVDGERSGKACLEHLQIACASIDAELILCEASITGAPPPEEQRDGAVRHFRFPADTLTPMLWTEGFTRSSGRVVAFTTAHCLVAEPWARALVAAVDAGAAGAGGPLVIAPGTGPLDWAVYYLRYSAFMPETIGNGRVSGEIAGDNAAYARSALDRHASSLARGVWDVDVHRLLRADGEWIAAVPAATAAFAPSFRFRTIATHRVHHGRQFGAGRVAGGHRSAWQVAAAAPLVPAVLVVRAGRRVWRSRRERWRFLVALPWFTVLAGAWALGEAWGALRGEGE